MSHKIALITIASAAVLDLAAGSVFAVVERIPEADGLYWAIATATTVGYGDIVPHTSPGRILAIIVMLTVVPLFAATFSLFTSALTATHVRKSENRIKEHVEQKLMDHHISLVKHMRGGGHG